MASAPALEAERVGPGQVEDRAQNQQDFAAAAVAAASASVEAATGPRLLTLNSPDPIPYFPAGESILRKTYK